MGRGPPNRKKSELLFEVGRARLLSESQRCGTTPARGLRLSVSEVGCAATATTTLTSASGTALTEQQGDVRAKLGELRTDIPARMEHATQVLNRATESDTEESGTDES